MSEPPNNTPTSSIIHHHQQYLRHQQQQQQQQSFISPTITPIPSPSPSPSPSTSLIREYRKGNWTLHETLVLIAAKKLDDERRTKASTTPPDPTNPNNKNNQQQQTSSSSTRTAELRWKWVENYCWNNGCLRSQNQCNDKWDNLLRDYKKVREYEARSTNATGSNDQLQSYWKLEKHERKERNLPTNLSSDVFEALNEVVHRRYTTTTPKSTPSSSSNAATDTPIQQVIVSSSAAPPLLLPPPPSQPSSQQQQPPPLQFPPPPPQTVSAETTESSSETDQSERVDSETKRRRKAKAKAKSVGSSILKSASVLAQTLMNCEEKKEKRHKDIIELEQRRLHIEETRDEVNRQGIAGLISAVNNLSGAIQALVSDRHNGAN